MRGNPKSPYPPFHPLGDQDLPFTYASDIEFRTDFPQESQYVEFKSSARQKPIQEAVVALSNADGGVILIGVDDAGQVLGRDLTQGLEETIHQTISESRNPGRYTLHRLDVAGRPVVVLAVAPRVEGFAQTSSGRILVRRGPGNHALFDADLLRFVQDRSLVRYELQEVDVDRRAISASALEELREAFSWPAEDATADRLYEQHLVATSGKLTVAGSLYLLDDPADALGKAFVEVLRYPEDEGTSYDRRLEFRGPLQHQVRDATQFVLEELGTDLVVLGTQRHELPRLPPVVVREALANAVAHRQYEDSRSSVRVEMRPSAVSVSSPGPLPTPVTVENLRNAQAPRNVAVIRVLRRFGVAEDAGLGVDAMQDSMRAAMLDAPTFEDNGHSVRVTLPIRSTVTARERAWVRELESRGTIEPVDRVLLVYAARGEILTNKKAREISGLDRVEATRALQRLRRAGFLQQHGNRGGSSYQLVGGLGPPAGLRIPPDAMADEIVLMAERGPVANADVRARFEVDRTEALRLLDGLVRDGRLLRVGQRRGARYIAPGGQFET